MDEILEPCSPSDAGAALIEEIAAAIAVAGYSLVEGEPFSDTLQQGTTGLPDRVLRLHLFAQEHGWRAVSRLRCTSALVHGPTFPSPAALDRWRATGELPTALPVPA